MRRNLRYALTLGVFLAVASPATAAVVLVDGSTPATEDFNSFAGSSASVPANFATSGAWTFGSPARTLTTGISTYNSATGWYALNDNDSPLDIAIGGRTNATDGFGYLTWAIQNGSGGTLPGLTIQFDVEQYTSADSVSAVDVRWSPTNSSFTSASLLGDVQTVIPDTNDNGTVYADPIITAGRTVYLDQPIANGDTVYVQFQFNPVLGGARPHFGIDNASVVGVPEPTALLALGLPALLLLRPTQRKR